ncbi:MAG: RNA-binding transcriptional accessory protein [Planctomycetes bacterium]|nr:RNA-binding transcriptional accessory protein [Planctomycetota bacterium]
MEAKNFEEYTHLIVRLVGELGISLNSITTTIKLLSEGNTIPFISRYRKELTGSLDESQIESIEKRFDELVQLEDRRTYILKSISDQGKLTEELEKQINAVETLHELEDLYLPYKPRRRTKAQIGREKGLEEPAMKIMSGELTDRSELEQYIDEEKELPDIETVELWISYIIAEEIAHDSKVRAEIRDYFWDTGLLAYYTAVNATDETGKFKDLDGAKYKLEEIPGHRILAGNRGEREEAVNVKLEVDEEGASGKIKPNFLLPVNPTFTDLVEDSIVDAYNRLVYPSMVTETRKYLTEDADVDAIEVFAKNLVPILLSPPLGAKGVLGLDPGYRTGCKCAAISDTGTFLEDEVIYPVAPKLDVAGASNTVIRLLKKHDLHFVALGNGTASRETEDFLRKLQKQAKDLQFEVIVVAETGASVYSASKLAREEFPKLDVTVRGAISIARRLQDPLAELVKIDPKSIGVGQYQHDVDQKKLKAALDRVIEHCVNAVGVDLNTASWALLSYVSGLNQKTAKNIVAHRDTNGFFKNRRELKKVKGLGAKTYEQCAGFLRIREGDNILDNTAVHPESYKIVSQMAKMLEVSLPELIGQKKIIDRIKANDFVDDEKGVGLPTIIDIIDELNKPGRDPRGKFEIFKFADVEEIGDLEEGMQIPGIVMNVTNFGAFVDVGVHQDGLVHISQLADKFVDDPSEVVQVGQKVNIEVLEVDVRRKRISLTMKGIQQP